MKKIIIIACFLVAAAGIASGPAYADVNKGQKIFIKTMKGPCGFTGGDMAKKHTQAEWKSYSEAGKLNDVLINECPNAKPLKESYLQHVYDFLYNYASDSGNVPAC